jgi:ribosomal protein S18 acetylase RimI-like enzyme
VARDERDLGIDERMMIGGGGVVGTMDVVAVVGGVSVRDGECSEAGEDGTSSAAYMANLCVHPNARRQSIGVRMIEYARCVAALWGECGSLAPETIASINA